MYQDQSLNCLTLGKKTQYAHAYDPSLLQPVPRRLNRENLGIDAHLPFTQGADFWTAFELSWLNPKGLPKVAIAQVSLDFRSENLIESKSFKLYLNSFNQAKFASIKDVEATLQRDLAQCAQGDVRVTVRPLQDFTDEKIADFQGVCLDDMDIEIENYQFNADLLANCCESDEVVEETLVSHLLKSNCLITHQPDWGSVKIHYVGRKIHHEKLLRYLISFREHNEFHEQCVERIYCDLLRFAQPQKLTVYARYTRRGGLDINPFRSNFETVDENLRLARQ